MTLVDECREEIQRWVDALRSGTYRQARNSYCTWVKRDEEPDGGHWELCALGVYYDVNGVGEWVADNPEPDHWAGPVHYVYRPDNWLTIGVSCLREHIRAAEVIDRNDRRRHDFATIADWAEDSFLNA